MGLLLRLAERTGELKIFNVTVNVKFCVSQNFNLWKNADVIILRLEILQTQNDTSSFTFLEGFTGPFSQNVKYLFYVYVYVSRKERP